MSQAKVDKYKESKANRKANVKKDKLKKNLRVAIVSIVCVLCVGYLVYSGVNSIKSNQTKTYKEVNVSALQNYLGTLDEE